MATKRAQITEETAGHMYEDVLDRLTDRKPARRSIAQAKKLPAAQTTEQPRVKATFYLTRQDILAIDTMQSEAFMQSGKKPERSQLISLAIQALMREKKTR